MDLKKLAGYGRDIQVLMEGTIHWEMDRAIERVIQQEDWELLGYILLTASEVAATPLMRKLLELEVYEPLVMAACMRRQIRRAGDVATGGLAGRVFRDWDAEDGGKAVPEHIRLEAEEIAQSARRQRVAMTVRAAEVDRDFLRDSIVTRLGEELSSSEPALEALLAIAQASAWEETRRTAAIKIANHDLSVAKLARELRTAEVIAVARATGLGAIAGNLARALEPHLEKLKEAADEKALSFVAEHHPEERVQTLAREMLEGEK